MTMFRENAEDQGRMGENEMVKVKEQYDARMKTLQDSHLKELEAVKKELDELKVEHKKEIERVKVGVEGVFYAKSTQP